ncbi:MAG TPA: SDR family NAD(P)-dependent oxidoreductase [Acidimicrobiia bacterium]|nr:SDR family NAD(P)-dependent oxidoreductase [Acidimicrobiia bacterium]HWW45085.1 SDR family NAD(P)-dependent oxidoreductase [Acidimicrobiia bacterium]
MTIRDWSAFIAGRVALVTGAGAGIGRAIAIQMARAGATIWVNDLDLGRAETVCGEIAAEGGTARPVIADVCDGDSVARMYDETGPLDILVNNAGSGVRAWGGGGQRLVAFAESGPEDWDPVIRVNLAGVLHVSRVYLPAMLDARWGRILVIVSDAGRRGERRQVVYGAAKAAAMGFVRGLAAEVGRDGVTVNCISLGSMKHAALADAIDADPDLETKLARAYPVGRLGRVEDPAPLAVLLCSDAAEWITGQVYPVDGGYAPAL